MADDGTRTSAPQEGPEWSARAEAWADFWGEFSAPAWPIVGDAAGITAGTRVLDVGCGSGEFCRMAAGRGALVSGIDAAAGMIEIARRTVPSADLRVGPMELLPWNDGAFDVVTGFNAFQFAADAGAALSEARRVTALRGTVAICNWATMEERQLFIVIRALQALQRQADPPTPAPPAVGRPDVLEELASESGLTPMTAGAIAVPYEASDLGALERALLAGAGLQSVADVVGQDTARTAIRESAAPFRRADGSYRFENSFRYLITQRVG